MCKHRSIFIVTNDRGKIKKEAKNKADEVVVVDAFRSINVRERLIIDGVIEEEKKGKEKKIKIKNIKTGANVRITSIRITRKDPNNLKDKGISPIDGYEIIKVMLAFNEVYHIKKGETYYDSYSKTEKKATEEYANNICKHETGHKEISYRIIPEDVELDVIEEFKYENDTEKKLNAWREQVMKNCSEKYLEIYEKSKKLYHDIYGENGSPWTFDRDGEPCNETGSSWQDRILKKLVDSYGDFDKNKYLGHLSEKEKP